MTLAARARTGSAGKTTIALDFTFAAEQAGKRALEPPRVCRKLYCLGLAALPIPRPLGSSPPRLR